MFPLGFFIVAAGLWLVSSAVTNRGPIETLTAIIKNPGGTQETLTKTKGTGFVVTKPGDVGFVGPVAGSPDAPQGPAVGTGKAAGAVNFAIAQIGKPYVWGATGPKAFDCSGLMQAAYASIGVKISRVTATQINDGTRVARANLRPGDLIFPYPGHVMMYVGGDRCVEAPRPGKTVQYCNIYQFLTARRIVP